MDGYLCESRGTLKVSNHVCVGSAWQVGSSLIPYRTSLLYLVATDLAWTVEVECAMVGKVRGQRYMQPRFEVLLISSFSCFCACSSGT